MPKQLKICSPQCGFNSPSKDEESLLALLTTAEGQNRLDLIDQKITDLDKEVGSLYQLELAVQQDIASGAEKQEWTLSDIMFLLQEIKQKLNDIDDQVHP